MELIPLDCGALTADAGMFEADSAAAPVRVPVPSWLIRHPSGDVVFDTGLHPELATSSERLGFLANVFTVHLASEATVGPRLRGADVDPDRVATVILSHLHYDHAGGLFELPNARVLVQADEWQAGADPDAAARNAYSRADYDLGHDVVQLHGEHDVFGDGRVVCVPTPGHTPGHQSLRLRLDSGEVLLAADACYFERTIDGGALPPFAHDHAQQAATRDRIRDIRASGVRVIPGHDPDVWAALPPRVT